MCYNPMTYRGSDSGALFGCCGKKTGVSVLIKCVIERMHNSESGKK